uniref:ERAP1-like C-terminal domain-containing protein n=2 Tax=Octopus bimaculoides TaxID=37653 RepID=A0A0L8GD67_OCTBM
MWLSFDCGHAGAPPLDEQIDPRTYAFYKWEIPFTFTTSREMNFNKTNKDIHWIHKNESEVQISSSVLPRKHNSTDWVIGNIRLINYYRVTYDNDNWMAIIEQLKRDHTVIHISNRIQIFWDSWALANSGHLDTLIALRTLEYLKKEKAYLVWSTARNGLSLLKRMLYKTPRYGDFQRFIRNLVKDLYKDLGWNNTQSNNNNHNQSLRLLIVAMACDNELKECKDAALSYFQQWVDTGNIGLELELNSIIYCIGVRYGDEDEWNFVYNKYKTSTVVIEKSSILNALSCTRHPWLLNKYLKISMNPEKIRYQDVSTVLSGISSNPIGEKIVWDFIRSNWDELATKFADQNLPWSTFRGISKKFNDEFGLKEVKYWMTKDQYVNKYRDQYEEVISYIKSNIKLMDENYKRVSDWLDHQAI